MASLVDRYGHVEAAKMLGLSRMTLYRVLDERPVFPSTLALIRKHQGAPA